MIISDVRCELVNQEEELSAKILPATSQDGDFRVWFRIPAYQGHLTVSGDPFLAGFLIPCMYAGEDLHIEASISERLLKNTSSVQALLTTWYPQLQKISVTCADTYKMLPGIEKENLGQGSCFSGGIDSWYSVLKHQKTISHLILIRGFDVNIQEKDRELWQITQQNMQLIADCLEKQLITITTNLRAKTDFKWLFNPKWAISWTETQNIWGKRYKGSGHFMGEYLQGSILGAVGLSLGRTIAEFIIPSSYPYVDLRPWGSHPLLDPLWSTDNVHIIHDGCEANRLEKIRKVSQSDLALKTLKVCHEDPINQYNCCQCEKCIRTMIQLELAGCLQQAESFPQPLDLQKVKLLKLATRARHHYHAIACEAQKIGNQELLETSKILLGEKFSADRFYHLNIKPFQKNVQTQLGKVKSKLKYLPKKIGQKTS